MRGGQHQFVEFTVRRGNNHDQLADARHLGRQGIHQHRRGIGRLAARHVQTDTVEWRDLLAKNGAVRLGVGPAFHLLTFGIGAYALGRMLQRLALIRRDRFPGLAQARKGDLQVGCRLCLPGIEAVRVVDKRGVAARSDLRNDLVHHLVHRAVRDRIPGQKGVQLLLEISVGGVQFANICHCSIPC